MNCTISIFFVWRSIRVVWRKIISFSFTFKKFHALASKLIKIYPIYQIISLKNSFFTRKKYGLVGTRTLRIFFSKGAYSASRPPEKAWKILRFNNQARLISNRFVKNEVVYQVWFQVISTMHSRQSLRGQIVHWIGRHTI